MATGKAASPIFLQKINKKSKCIIGNKKMISRPMDSNLKFKNEFGPCDN